MKFSYPKKWTIFRSEKKINRIFNELANTLDAIDIKSSPDLAGFHNLHTSNIWTTGGGERTLDIWISLATPYEFLIPQFLKRHNTEFISEKMIKENKAFKRFMHTAEQKKLAPIFKELANYNKILVGAKPNFRNIAVHIQFDLNNHSLPNSAPVLRS